MNVSSGRKKGKNEQHVQRYEEVRVQSDWK